MTNSSELPSSPPEVSTSPQRRGPGIRIFAALIAFVVVAGGLAIAGVMHRRNENQSLQPLRLSGIPASVPTSLANLMALSPVPAKSVAAFNLTDQNGHAVTLNDLKGRAVVLEFMDTHCTDICPIVSQEFVDAYHDLGAAAANVVFLAINVNQYHARVSDAAAFSREHGLDSIPSWHFLTGSVPALKATWKNYGVDVIAPSPNADVIHSSLIFFIDPQGRLRYLGNPTDDHSSSGAAYLPTNQMTGWGQGIALVALSLVS